MHISTQLDILSSTHVPKRKRRRTRRRTLPSQAICRTNDACPSSSEFVPMRTFESRHLTPGIRALCPVSSEQSSHTTGSRGIVLYTVASPLPVGHAVHVLPCDLAAMPLKFSPPPGAASAAPAAELALQAPKSPNSQFRYFGPFRPFLHGSGRFAPQTAGSNADWSYGCGT